MKHRYWGTFLVANSLTLARLAAGLAFPWIPVGWRPAVVLAAGASDLIDGAISRAFSATSTFGQLLDPIADKAFLLMVIGTLWSEGTIELWQIALLGLREWVVLAIALGLVLTGNWEGLVRMKPRWLGKAATAGQLAYLISLLFLPTADSATFAAAVFLSGLAGADYFWHGLRMLKADRAEA